MEGAEAQARGPALAPLTGKLASVPGVRHHLELGTPEHPAPTMPHRRQTAGRNELAYPFERHAQGVGGFQRGRPVRMSAAEGERSQGQCLDGLEVVLAPGVGNPGTGELSLSGEPVHVVATVSKDARRLYRRESHGCSVPRLPVNRQRGLRWPVDKRPPVSPPTAHDRFLTAVDADSLHPVYLLLGLVGLRRGEAVALRWTDVDLNQGLLRVEQSVVEVGRRSVVGPPKSASGARTVALDDETCRRLHWHAARQGLDILRETGTITVPELVFTTPRGEPLDPSFVSRHFERLVTRHGLPRIRLRDLRHT